MIAVHLEKGAVTTRTLPVPTRPDGFALLRLLAGGICNTDLELQRGYYAFAGTPGHEFAVRLGVLTETAATLPVAAYDWVVDATGSPEGLRSAAAMARPRGTVILKSTMHGVVPVDTAPIIVNELTLVGSRCGRFAAALPLLRHPLVRVEELIAARFPLSEAPQAFARAAEKGVLKVLLE
jgi:threonine dehydrogenase-like Zn-dependent dehydrogenase